MEGLASLVTESMVRHGFEATFDHRRLQWSNWFRCHDGFSLLQAPFKAGIFALAEEIVPAGENSSNRDRKRTLAIFHLVEADDLGMALGRMLLTGNILREHLANGRCFARYVVIEDAGQRHAACTALRKWMATSGHEPSFVSGHDFSRAARAASTPALAAVSGTSSDAQEQPRSSNNKAQIGPPTPIPSGF
jgi:hypothetical protein